MFSLRGHSLLQAGSHPGKVISGSNVKAMESNWKAMEQHYFTLFKSVAKRLERLKRVKTEQEGKVRKQKF